MSVVHDDLVCFAFNKCTRPNCRCECHDVPPVSTYTPTTEQVRNHAWRYFRHDDVQSSDEADAEFDRWFKPFDDALAAVQHVRKEHKKRETKMVYEDGSSREIVVCAKCGFLYPCQVIAALDGSPMSMTDPTYTPTIHDALCPCALRPEECAPSTTYGVCGSCRCAEYAKVRADEREKACYNCSYEDEGELGPCGHVPAERAYGGAGYEMLAKQRAAARGDGAK